MQEERAHDDIVIVGQRLAEDIQLAEGDVPATSSLPVLSGVLGGCGADVDPVDLQQDVFAGGPMRHADHHVAAAASDIEHPPRTATVGRGPCGDLAPYD